MNDGFLVRVQYTSKSSLVVAPHGEKFGGLHADIHISGNSQIESPIIPNACIILHHDDERHVNNYK